ELGARGRAFGPARGCGAGRPGSDRRSHSRVADRSPPSASARPRRGRGRMNPAVLAGVWAGCGVAAAVLLPPLRRRRLGWVAPLAAGLAGLAAASRLPWPGPAASPSYGAGLVLGRPALGLLLLAGPALAVGIALAPTLDGGEVLTACLVGAACAVVLSATVPVVWSL